MAVGISVDTFFYGQCDICHFAYIAFFSDTRTRQPHCRRRRRCVVFIHGENARVNERVSD